MPLGGLLGSMQVFAPSAAGDRFNLGLGQVLGGLGMFAAGAGLEGAGLLLDATGLGAIIGVTANVAGAVMMATAAGNAVRRVCYNMAAGASKGGGGGSTTTGSQGPSTPRTTNPAKAESKVWQNAEPYKDGLRRNGKEIWDWDKLHNDIEVYDGRGRHLGSRDPTTGEMYKGPVTGRYIDL